MRNFIILLPIILYPFATCNAQISIDSIYHDVASIERQQYLQDSSIMDYLDIDLALSIRQKHHLAESLKFSSTNDTLYIYDRFFKYEDEEEKTRYSFMIWSQNSSVKLAGNETKVKDSSKYSFFRKYKNQYRHKEIELLLNWDTKELSRIGVKYPPLLVRSIYHSLIVVAQIIINDSQYSIRTVTYWGAGFEPDLWPDPINYQ